MVVRYQLDRAVMVSGLAARDLQIQTQCDGCHRPDVMLLTAIDLEKPECWGMFDKGYGCIRRQKMSWRMFVDAAAETFVIAVALMLALPFLLALSVPFIASW
jgi:hypothetical protein